MALPIRTSQYIFSEEIENVLTRGLLSDDESVLGLATSSSRLYQDHCARPEMPLRR